MENRAVQIIKDLAEELEAMASSRDLYREMYRMQKERADKAEAAIKAKGDNF